MKLKGMTVGQRILYKHYSRVWNSRRAAMWTIKNLGDIDKRLANAIDREIRKVAARFWSDGLAERGFDPEFSRPKKPAKKGAKKWSSGSRPRFASGDSGVGSLAATNTATSRSTCTTTSHGSASAGCSRERGVTSRFQVK